jgi:hypothetical protein
VRYRAPHINVNADEPPPQTAVIPSRRRVNGDTNIYNDDGEHVDPRSGVDIHEGVGARRGEAIVDVASEV